MFPTFTGNSRRPRNVNLSGQKSDPFAGTAWGSAATSGPSKSVSEAQADRQRRQRERDRLKAAQKIQRLWRGHRERQAVRTTRRQAFDALFTDEALAENPEERLQRAFPLLLDVYNLSRDDDYQRLCILSPDLLRVDHILSTPDLQSRHRLKRLVGIIVTSLNRKKDDDDRSNLLLRVLVRIIESQPSLALDHVDSYYKVLATLCRQAIDTDPTEKDLLQRAITAPLIDGAGRPGPESQVVYSAFVLGFLTEPDLALIEQDPALIGNRVDPIKLSSAVLDASIKATAAGVSKKGLLWLLAHFIDLQRTQSRANRSFTDIKAMYNLLSSLASTINTRLGASSSTTVSGSGNDSDSEESRLPNHVTKNLLSLVDRKEVSSLLEKFAANYAETSSSGAVQDASVLAGYILVLIRSFPNKSDDIRMRLYLADFPCQAGKLPAIKLFWDAAVKTQVFSRIISNENSTLNFLLQRNYFQSSSATGSDSTWDSEWRTVLLFLELYVFILRLTDDEDFFNGLTGRSLNTKPASRVSYCTLPLEDLKKLSLFLKNLGFTLYNNAAELLRADSTTSRPRPTTDQTFSQSASNSKSRRPDPPSFSVISGIDYGEFKKIVLTAVRMLYERDSRRSFLPSGHWLMTSRFDMDGFTAAVVMEEQRQHELRENSSDDEEDDDDDEVEMPTAPPSQPVAQTWAGQRRSRHAAVEEYRSRQQKVANARMREFLAPKLEVLRNMPFSIPFETRIRIFRDFVHLDKERRRKGHVDPDQWRHHMMTADGFSNPFEANHPGGAISKHHAKISRGSMFDDAFEQFWGLGQGLKEPIQITFVDQFDTVEAGIDGGGVTKEFLISVTTEAFSSKHNLFVSTKENALYPNPSSLDQLQDSMRRSGISEGGDEWRLNIRKLLAHYEFLGRIVGKCMYEGILVDIAFAGFFLLKWSAAATDHGYRANVNDLREMDEELYQGLLRLKSMDDVSQLGLDFTVTDQVSLTDDRTVTVTRELIPNGKNITVTNENRPLFISYMARHRLVTQSYQQTQAFLRGLGTIVSPSWLSMFNQTELQWLVGGEQSEIDVYDLRRHTTYNGVYTIGDDGEEHPTVKLFWQAMHEFQDSERRDVLKFVTSTPRAPLLGFSQLVPSFTIRDGGLDLTRLPSASTCVNLMKLPQYQTLEQLKTKLKYAISSNAGFDLS
ncbi:hypothetical protein PpBr36_03151 [Pyricularia pennisetigena]|uniref:hypothetical protein n=1 Tax=Pyricularia pennisetigena TaxID=1578925 RepID=UPI001153FD47|nr:hypothetical protein PpBr36_03151 [Pyricularia pennisetigena]TLS29894.1 hypothetical protein PpBr36_03151 [Pyricularia pennisetigena]